MTTPSTDELRTWARQNGFEVADRGRLSAKVLTAWQASQEAKNSNSAPAALSTNGGPEKPTRPEQRPAADSPPPVTEEVIVDLRDEVSTLRARVEALESRVSAPRRRLFGRS